MKELFDLIEKLKSMKYLSADAIGKVLKTRLSPRPDANPYFKFYHASVDSGPFASAEFSEPSTGARSNDRRLNLDIRSGVEVSYAEVAARYGVGSIFQVIPEAAPEGKVIYLYEEPGQKVFFEFSGRTYRLLGVTICRGSCL